MSDEQEERRDDEMTSSAYEAAEELRDERAREGLGYLDVESDDDASGLRSSPFQRLVAAYAESRRLAPDAALLHLQFGIQFLQVSMLDAAVEALKQAVRCDATLADAHYYLARALAESGRVDEALKAYETARGLDSKLFEARLEHELLKRSSGSKRSQNRKS